MDHAHAVRRLALGWMALATMFAPPGCSSGDRPRIPVRGAEQDAREGAEGTLLPPAAGGRTSSEPRAARADNGDERGTQSQSAPGSDVDTKEGADSAPRRESVWPPYVSLLGKLQADDPASITTTSETQRSLSLTTRNVSRFQVRRDSSPLRHGINVILRIDGQALEWTGRYEALVLERSRNGVWEVVERVDRAP